MSKSALLVPLLLLFAFGLAACGGGGDSDDGELVVSEDLQIIDLQVGTGAEVKPGDTAFVNYTGTLADGTIFDSSLDPGRLPFRFLLGAGEVIEGWDQGIAGMRVGGTRRLIIPPELAYGEAGSGPLIPPNAELTFEIELLDLRSPDGDEPTGEAGPDATPVVSEGLQIIDIEIGTGLEAQQFRNLTVHYTGTLADGTVFDSSRDPGREPFTFTLGIGQVITGWDQGLVGMKAGGSRTLIIAPELAYGEAGFGDTIPPNAELTFEIELLDVR